MKDHILNKYDKEAAKILDAFLPDKLFDAHMHISLYPFDGMNYFGFEEYYRDMAPLLGKRRVRCNALATPTDELKTEQGHEATVKFFSDQLTKYPENVGEILVKPHESADEIERHLIHPNIKGLKCYHIYADRPDTFNAGLNEYLPESAFEVASKHKMAITLHMVKDNALADLDNMRQIKAMAKKYPDATLILAHAARSFASWTAIETVAELRDYENVWYDFSGVCESPAMIQILKKIGVSRCMWGSDYNVCMLAGKCVSIADTFYWIGERDLPNFTSKTTLHNWHTGTENLMAVRQACMLTDLTSKDIDDLFYNNASRLFDK